MCDFKFGEAALRLGITYSCVFGTAVAGIQRRRYVRRLMGVSCALWPSRRAGRSSESTGMQIFCAALGQFDTLGQALTAVPGQPAIVNRLVAAARVANKTQTRSVASDHVRIWH